ncbi:3-oxoacyl-[acyl-carrier-protein] synthase III C-terminal domain-containing protein [Mycolicibacterium sp. XJ1819]
MGTIIENVHVTRGGWRRRHSALRLADAAAKGCLRGAGRHPRDLDLLVNAGLHRDRNLGEPALAAMIQDDIGANPEDPHANGHGTFSFDVANGTCGVITALQIVDGFLRSSTVDSALIVASDADPGGASSEHFPYSPVGAAMSCTWDAGHDGLGQVYWTNKPDGGESYRATAGLVNRHNVLRLAESQDFEVLLAEAAAEAARRCLREESLDTTDVDVIVAAPARRAYRAALAERLGVAAGAVVVADDEHTHTASLAAAFERGTQRLPGGARVLLVAAAAGITAGAALYRIPG